MRLILKVRDLQKIVMEPLNLQKGEIEMKKTNKLLTFCAALGLMAITSCSSDHEYLVEQERPLGAQEEQAQRQTEAKPQSQYSDEDWFYDYYDLTEEEKEKIEE